jgi:hypothetical protein
MNFKINHRITNCWSQPLNTSNHILSNGSKNVQQCSPCEMYRRESPIITCIYNNPLPQCLCLGPTFQVPTSNTAQQHCPEQTQSHAPMNWNYAFAHIFRLVLGLAAPFFFSFGFWLIDECFFIMKSLLNENGIIISNFNIWYCRMLY